MCGKCFISKNYPNICIRDWCDNCRREIKRLTIKDLKDHNSCNLKASKSTRYPQRRSQESSRIEDISVLPRDAQYDDEANNHIHPTTTIATDSSHFEDINVLPRDAKDEETSSDEDMELRNVNSLTNHH